MRLLRASLLAAALAAAPAVFAPTDAGASVSIAVAFDALVKDADAVAVVSPQESTSVWEDGRIYTYTRVKVDQSVAGDVGGGDAWVRTMGGVVGKIGQLVDGEPVLVAGKQSLLFVRRFKSLGTWEVSARAQGQFPIVLDEAKKAKKVIRSGAAGVLLPPKTNIPTTRPTDGVQPQAIQGDRVITNVRLAGEVLHDRSVDDVTREIAAAWKAAHPAPAQ